jgi:hypothetical protein
LFVVIRSMTTAHIYRESLTRVTTYRNRLGLSLSKHIRHRLITKINNKRKSLTSEALDRILTDHSHARHAPVPIASPRRDERGMARRGEASEHMCFSFSPLLHILARDGNSGTVTRYPSGT